MKNFLMKNFLMKFFVSKTIVQWRDLQIKGLLEIDQIQVRHRHLVLFY